MNINTTETHHRSHRLTLKQSEVDDIIKAAVRQQIPGLSRKSRFVIRWTQESYHSGLAKRPQIEVEVIEDLTPDETPASPP